MRRISLDKFGFRIGSKRSTAAKLYESGATQAELISATGTTQYNMLKDAERRGHHVIRKGNRFWLIHKSDDIAKRDPLSTDSKAPSRLNRAQRRTYSHSASTEYVQCCPSVVSIIGWHADESPKSIIDRKHGDIEKTGLTIWAYRSQKASVETVQKFAQLHPNPTVYFIEGQSVPTKTNQQASEMSEDGILWEPLPSGIDKVTARLPVDGLVLKELASAGGQIDTWVYLEYPSQSPLRFRRGASTACAVPSSTGMVEGMKSHMRKVVAVGKLGYPYAVRLR